MAETEAGTHGSVVVVYALSDEQHMITVEIEPGMTALDAVKRSGLTERFPEILSDPIVLGSFGHEISPEHKVDAGMRVEICRSLQRDPRELRRVMASLGMVMGQRDR